MTQQAIYSSKRKINKRQLKHRQTSTAIQTTIEL